MKSGTEVCDCSWISPLSSPSRKTAASKKFPESTHRYDEDSEDVLGSSPTSVIDNFVQNTNKTIARSNNTIATSLVASESKTKIKTLIKGYSWDLPAETKYASEVKKILSSNSSIATEDMPSVLTGDMPQRKSHLCCDRRHAFCRSRSQVCSCTRRGVFCCKR